MVPIPTSMPACLKTAPVSRWRTAPAPPDAGADKTRNRSGRGFSRGPICCSWSCNPSRPTYYTLLVRIDRDVQAAAVVLGVGFAGHGHDLHRQVIFGQHR